MDSPQPHIPQSKKHDLTISIFTRLIQFNSVQLIQSYNTKMAFNSVKFNNFQSNFHPINSVQLIQSYNTEMTLNSVQFNTFQSNFNPINLIQFNPINSVL